MKHILLFVCLAVAVLTFVPGCDDIRYDLQITLDKAVEAEVTGNGAAFLEVLDPQEIAHYDRLISMARTGTRDQIRRLPPSDRLTVTYVRATMTGEQLRKLDARGLLSSGFSRWGIGDGRPDITIGRIKHRPPRAQAELVIDGVWTNDWVEFVKIEDTWYFSDRAVDRWVDQLISEHAGRTNRSEDYVVLSLASMMARRHIDDRIWDAPPK